MMVSLTTVLLIIIVYAHHAHAVTAREMMDIRLKCNGICAGSKNTTRCEETCGMAIRNRLEHHPGVAGKSRDAIVKPVINGGKRARRAQTY